VKPTKLETIPLKVEVEYALTHQRIEDLLITAFEGGINYWAQIYKTPEQPYWEAKVKDFEADKAETYQLSMEKVVEGLKVCAKKYPRHFGDFIDENGDATTADVIVQCALFGEIVYG